MGYKAFSVYKKSPDELPCKNERFMVEYDGDKITGIFDKIAKFAGAGTLVPITGFSNAVVSPAIEFKSEGYVLGVGAKMFTIAGPVIVYGVGASVVYGFIYWITTIF